MIENLYDLNS